MDALHPFLLFVIYTLIEYSIDMEDIKQTRKKTKLSQSEFSEKFGIPVRTLQKWEQKESDPLPYLLSLIQNEISLEEYIDITKYQFVPQNYFRKIIKNTFKNITKIHPIQQDNVYQIIEALKKYQEVQKIIIFGSSTTYRCNYDSDLDVYVELSSRKNVKTYHLDCPVDFWTNFTVEQEMLEHIQETGVIVYDR